MSRSKDHLPIATFSKEQAWDNHLRKVAAEVAERELREKEAEHLTAERVAREVAAIHGSLLRSHEILWNSLSLGCPGCGSAKGVFCLGTTQGICQVRWDKGRDISIPAPLRPGELRPFADAHRNAELRERQRAAPEAQRRHPNRNPSTHVKAAVV